MLAILVAYGTKIATALIALVVSYLGLSAAQQLWLRGFLARLLVEARAVVREVEQTYVEEVKRARLPGSDGGVELTPVEAGRARAMAITTLKANLGAKGLRRLARIIGLKDVDAYLGSHVESQVHQLEVEKAKSTTNISVQSMPPQGIG